MNRSEGPPERAGARLDAGTRHRQHISPSYKTDSHSHHIVATAAGRGDYRQVA
jgi:hypothetical protein